MPFPMAKATHPAHPLAANVGSEHRPKAIPPMPHGLVAQVDPAFEEQVFDVPQRQMHALVDACVLLWRHAAQGPASSRCRTEDASGLSVRSSTAIAISSNASSTNSSISEPSPRDTTSATTTFSPQSNLLRSGSGCDIMSRWPRPSDKAVTILLTRPLRAMSGRSACSNKA